MNGLIAHRVPWINRRFQLKAKPEDAAELIDRLSGAPDRVAAKIKRADDSACGTCTDGGWSIKQNAGHLGDLESLWSIRTQQFIDNAGVLEPADMSNQSTISADHNSCDITDLSNRFRDARARLCDTLARLEMSVFAHLARHARLGAEMTLAQHCEFIAMHDDYHLARIEYLIIQI